MHLQNPEELQGKGMSTSILLINTGGTFNKFYDAIDGTLKVDSGCQAIEQLTKAWRTKIDCSAIIGKDSLEMTGKDRLELLAMIHQSPYEKIIVVHGTDTIHITAQYLDEADLQKQIILTGAMVPYSIDPVEATANLASAYGALYTMHTSGVYIAMNGIIDKWDRVQKEREKGYFRLKKHA